MSFLSVLPGKHLEEDERRLAAAHVVTFSTFFRVHGDVGGFSVPPEYENTDLALLMRYCLRNYWSDIGAWVVSEMRPLRLTRPRGAAGRY